MLLSSDIMGLSFLEQVLDLLKFLYPSRKRKPKSSNRGKESKEEMTSAVKDIAGKENTTMYWLFLINSKENINASAPYLIFPDMSRFEFPSSPHYLAYSVYIVNMLYIIYCELYVQYILKYWTLKSKVYYRAEMK